MANSVDPDETARKKPSHLALYCLQRYLFWSTGMNTPNNQHHNDNQDPYFN